jgi:FMN phosphatase YigB (HAD superfamily)
MKDINYGHMPPTFEKPEEWISYYPKSSSAAPPEKEETADDRPLLIKIAGKVFPEGKAKERFNQKPYSVQQKYNDETFNRTHGDVFRERFGEKHPAYQRLMEMGDSLDKAHNLEGGKAIMGLVPNWAGVQNKWHKELLRDAFDDMGIERKY